MIEICCLLRNKEQGVGRVSESRKLRELTAAELAEERVNGTLILDTRPAEHFAAIHIRGSIQISLAGHFASWAAILLDPLRRLVLVAEDAVSAHEAHNRLARVGLCRNNWLLNRKPATMAQRRHRARQHSDVSLCGSDTAVAGTAASTARRCSQPRRMAKRPSAWGYFHSTT